MGAGAALATLSATAPQRPLLCTCLSCIMDKAHILIIDDDIEELERCRQALATLAGTRVVAESRSTRTSQVLGEGTFDLVVTDLRMPMVDGLGVLRMAQALDPELPVVIMTGFPAVDTAVAAMREGAADYLSKPINLDELTTVAERLIEGRRLRIEHRFLRHRLDPDHAVGDMIGASPAMTEVCRAVRRLAATDVDVLVLGETGTGKELVARSLHRQRADRSGPFVPVDCAAMPEGLMERELFGHERGAFTGADRRSIGLMEFADGGTFFLDEVDALPPRLQAKLLRSLEERRVRRMGSTREVEVDIRVIAAAHQDLRALVDEGRFREDLYYRLNVGLIEVPALRDRSGDVPLLVGHFLAQHQSSEEPRLSGVAPDAMAALSACAWPGNVRQLRNVVRRALAMAPGPILMREDLPEEVAPAGLQWTGEEEAPFFELRARRQDGFERDYLSGMLQRCSGDVSEAARRSGVPRGTFYRLMKKHAMDPGLYRSRE